MIRVSLKRLLSLFFVLSTSMTWSLESGGDLVNNGGGLGEQNFTYAWLNYAANLLLCVETGECVGGEDEPSPQKVLDARNSIPDENIRFFSSEKNPGFFDSGYTERPSFSRVIRENRISYYYFNLDLLNNVDSNGVEQPITVSESASYLTDLMIMESFYLQGKSPDIIAIVLPFELENFLENKFMSRDLQSLGRSDVRALFLHERSADFSIDDASQVVKIQIPSLCKSWNKDWSDKSLPLMDDFSWRSEHHWEASSSLLWLGLRNAVTQNCLDSKGVSHKIKGQLESRLPFRLEKGGQRQEGLEKEWQVNKEVSLKFQKTQMGFQWTDLREAL